MIDNDAIRVADGQGGGAMKSRSTVVPPDAQEVSTAIFRERRHGMGTPSETLL